MFKWYALWIQLTKKLNKPGVINTNWVEFLKVRHTKVLAWQSSKIRVQFDEIDEMSIPVITSDLFHFSHKIITKRQEIVFTILLVFFAASERDKHHCQHFGYITCIAGHAGQRRDSFQCEWKNLRLVKFMKNQLYRDLLSELKAYSSFSRKIKNWVVDQYHCDSFSHGSKCSCRHPWIGTLSKSDCVNDK